MSDTPRRTTFAALSVRNFRLYFVGQLISVSGTWMQSVAQGWLVLQLTKSATDLGLVIALQWVPMLVTGSYGGVIVDRNEKRRILYGTQSGAGILALALGLAVSTHHATLTLVMVLAFLLGCVNLFDNPSRQSFVQEMVGKDLLANAVSLNSVLMNAGRVVGPGVAAAAISVLGTAQCFYLNAASYVAVIIALAMMRSAEFYPLHTVSREKGQLRRGLRYVIDNPLLRRTLIAVAVTGTFAYNFTVTLPAMAQTTFHRHDAATYGLMMAAMGVGAILGGLYTAWRSRPTAGLLAVLLTAFSLSMALVALAPTAAVTIALLVPTGAFSVAFISTANATMQLNSIGEMRGRVMALYAIGFLGTTPIGSPIVGVLVTSAGPRVAIMAGALISLAVGGWLLLSQRLRA